MINLYLLAHTPGIDISLENARGETPTDVCLRTHNIVGLKILWGVGVDKGAIGKGTRNTAFHLAAWYGDDELLDHLAQRKPDLINAVNNKGYSPLAIAVVWGDYIEYMTDVNIPAFHGYTALHFSYMSQDGTAIIEYLEGQGANKVATDNQNRTPHELSTIYTSNKRILKVLAKCYLDLNYEVDEFEIVSDEESESESIEQAEKEPGSSDNDIGKISVVTAIITSSIIFVILVLLLIMVIKSIHFVCTTAFLPMLLRPAALVALTITFIQGLWHTLHSDTGYMLMVRTLDIFGWEFEPTYVRKTFSGIHSSTICSIALSADGMMIATASVDGTVALLDVTTGLVCRRFDDHSHVVQSVVFSPDGQSIVSGSFDTTVKLWSTLGLFDHRTFEGHGDVVNSVMFSPDGKIVASGSDDKTVRLWKVETGDSQVLTCYEESPVTSVTFSQDGKLLTTGGLNERIIIWNLATRSKYRTLEGQFNPGKSLSFSPDCRLITSRSQNGKVVLWDVETGLIYRTIDGHPEGVSSAVFSPDGQVIATGSKDTKIRVWKVKGSRCLIFEADYYGATQLVFSKGGRLLVSVHKDLVKLWDV